jgi:hypothetical protein
MKLVTCFSLVVAELYNESYSLDSSLCRGHSASSQHLCLILYSFIFPNNSYCCFSLDLLIFWLVSSPLLSFFSCLRPLKFELLLDKPEDPFECKTVYFMLMSLTSRPDDSAD